jgi:HAD superfamily hydrolase (TIGR01450 family)
MIYDSVLDFKNEFDVFMLDAYGVFWDGAGLYEGSKELMEYLVKEGKIICILSNATRLSAEAEDIYGKKGIKKNEHYHEIITSGEFAKYMLEAKKIKGLAGHKKVYQFGTPNKTLFNNVKEYEITDNLKDADFVYISVPRFTETDFRSFSEEDKKYLFEYKSSNEGEPKKWDSTKLELFNNKIAELLATGLPFLNANPDFVASGQVKDENGRENYVVRQGFIAEELRKNGATVISFGKPNAEIYDFAFDKLENLGIDKIDKSRTIMVGDTLRTDIQGAINAGIKSALCVKTGITYHKIMELSGMSPKTSEELERAADTIADKEGIYPNYYIERFGLRNV